MTYKAILAILNEIHVDITGTWLEGTSCVRGAQSDGIRMGQAAAKLRTLSKHIEEAMKSPTEPE